MTERFGRDFLVSVGVRGGDILIQPPLRVNFSADKSIRGGLNKLNISLYNLTRSHTDAIAKNPDESRRIPISLSVGYEGRRELLFKGTIHRAATAPEWPDVVTTIECLDGGFDYMESVTNKTVEAGGDLVGAILADMPNTGVGKVAERQSLTRPKVLTGYSADLLRRLAGEDEDWYIDSEQLYIIGRDQVISRFIPLVTGRTGLIGTPEWENGLVTFQAMMNPAIKIGGRVRIESKFASNLDGTYKVETINYEGDNYGSNWTQTCTCLIQPDAEVL